MNTAHEIDDYASNCLYYIINVGEPKKWYVTVYSNYNKNGGQDTGEYEHDFGFATKAGAIKWANNDAKKIAEQKKEQSQ